MNPEQEEMLYQILSQKTGISQELIRSAILNNGPQNLVRVSMSGAVPSPQKKGLKKNIYGNPVKETKS